MESQDHKTAATPIGHEGHGVYLCHRCGWPFPKPHPSSKHRRAHKRHCGTIEGYTIIHSEEHDHNLAVSDDEHASDDEHTPSPNLVKANAEGSGKVGDKLNKSEDDVYSDAVADFSESGISPSLEARFESVREPNKIMEQKGVEGDLHGGGSLKVDEIADKTELANAPIKSEEVPSPEPLVSDTNQSGSVIPLTETTAEAVLGQGSIKSGHDSNIQAQEDKLVSVALNSEEGKISEEDLCDNSVSEVAKHDLPSQTETLEKLDASKEDNSVIDSAKLSASHEPVEVALVDETRENIDASVGVEEVSQTTKDILLDESISSTLSAKPEEGSQTLDDTKHVASVDSSIDKVFERKLTCYFDASEGELGDMNGKEKENMEITESSAMDMVPTPDSADKTVAPEDDQTTEEVKKGVEHGEEKSKDDSTGFPSSIAVESEARKFEELSKDEQASPVSRDDGSENKNALPTASLEVPVSSIISEPSQNISNGDKVESVDVAKTISELKEIVSPEKAPEHSTAEESPSLTTLSELLSENSANNVKASESIDTARVNGKSDHGDGVELSKEISENPTAKVLEASPTGIVSSGEGNGNVLAPEKCSATPSVKEPPSAETCATGDDKIVAIVEDVTSVDSKSLQAEVDDKPTKESDGVSAVNHSVSSSSRSDSLEANCGSVVSDTLETNSQKQRTEEARSDKSDTFEPPSFMTLVQPGGGGEQVKEIETEEKNQQPKPDALQAGWFPSIKNVVNESEGRKKNEEIIAKVTNWSPVNQQHGPLKSLLNEVKSPRSSPASSQKIETETKDTNNGGVATVGSVIAPEGKDQGTKKDAEEWNSPARYPIEIKKEKKKKGRSYWVPFVCCSSLHRDL